MKYDVNYFSNQSFGFMLICFITRGGLNNSNCNIAYTCGGEMEHMDQVDADVSSPAFSNQELCLTYSISMFSVPLYLSDLGIGR